MSFATRFEDGIRELGLRGLSQEVDARKLNFIRDDASGMFFGGRAEEAATRAFRELVLLNQRIPIEEKLGISFRNLVRIKWWHFQNKVNIDLLRATKQTTEELLSSYVGEEYESEYYSKLRQLGVIIPITHDSFRTIALSYLFASRKSGSAADSAASKLINDVYLKDKEGYASCVIEEAKFVYEKIIPT